MKKKEKLKKQKILQKAIKLLLKANEEILQA